MIEIEVSTHSGDSDIIEVDEYDARELAEKINDEDIHVINLGENIYSRIDIKNIKPVESE